MALLSGLPGTASAQESAEVEAILKRGIQLRRDGQDEAALAAFLEAEAQAPNSVRVLLHVATAAQAASKWLMADEYLKKAEAHSSDAYYVRYKAEIDEVRAITALRVGQFRAVGEPEGAEVILNGQVVGTLPMETPKTLESGTYVLEVAKQGFYRLRRPISVGGGVLTRETVELNERTGPGPDPADPTGAGYQEPESYWLSSGFTWTLGGVAIAAGITSGISFFLRDRAVQHWNDDSRCLSTEILAQTRGDLCSNVRNDIDTAEQVGVISGGLGVIFAGAALTHLLLTSGTGSSEPGVDTGEGRKQKGTGSLECSPGFKSVVCAGTF